MIPSGKDTQVFTGAMNQDIEGRFLREGDYRYLLNARSAINSKGVFGAIEDVMGNLLVSNSFLALGNNKCIGAYEDIAGQSCIFFVWNSQGYDGIFRWYANKGGPNGVIEKIYQVQDPLNNCLNFDEYTLITHVNLVNQLLLWVQDNEQPRCINIVKANTTDKPYSFNLYFNQILFNTPTSYSLTLYGTNTFTFTWTSSAPDYVGQVQDFIAAAQLSPAMAAAVIIKDKLSYAQITFIAVGDYIIVPSNGIYVIPDNFYPDKSVNPVSYEPLSKELITAVKYPPFGCPEAEYVISGGVVQEANLNWTSYTSSTPGWVAGFLGLNPVGGSYFDNIGIAVPGASTIVPQPGFFNFAAPSGYITNTTAQPIKLYCTFNVDATATGIVSGYQLRFGTYINSSTAPNNFIIISNPAGLGVFTVSTYITINPGQNWGVWLTSDQSNVALSITMNAKLVANQIDFGISDRYYKFRAKYIYDDFQESVYGAISTIPLPTQDLQNSIKIDFSDERLVKPELVCDIKNVIIAISDDNGLTWYEIAKLEPHEFVGQGRQVFYYDAKQTLIPVAPEEANLPYHNIPLLAKSQEYIDDRAFYGAVTTGYDKINADMVFTIGYTAYPTTSDLYLAAGTRSEAGWRRGWEGYIGIVYYDAADRKTPVIIDPNNSKVVIPYYSDVKTWDAAFVDWAINHEPPDWAVKYQLVRTQDLQQIAYLMWIADTYSFVQNDLTTVVAPNVGTYLRIDLQNAQYYNDNFRLGSQILFTPTEGDHVRFVARNLTFYDFNDYRIARVVGNFAYIKNDGNIPFAIAGNAGPYTGVVIEMYTPNPKDKLTPYYEFCECYPILEGTFNGVKKKYHAGPLTNQSYPGVPATGTSTTGDAFYRLRVFPFGSPSYLSQTQYIISSNTPLDSTSTIYDNDGRENYTDLLGQVYDPTGLIFTDKYFNATQINGINAVQPGYSESFNAEYGPINRLLVVNNDILKLIFGNSYQLSIYVSQGVIRQAGNTGTLTALASTVAQNSHMIQRTLGTITPESVRINDEGDMFGYDENEGVVWQSSGNGLLQVSDRGMKSIFKEYSNVRKAIGGKSEVPCVYDLFHDEYIMTFSPVKPPPAVPPVTQVIGLPVAHFFNGTNITVKISGGSTLYNGTPTSDNLYDFLKTLLDGQGYTTTINSQIFNVPIPNSNFTTPPIGSLTGWTSRDLDTGATIPFGLPLNPWRQIASGSARWQYGALTPPLPLRKTLESSSLQQIPNNTNMTVSYDLNVIGALVIPNFVVFSGNGTPYTETNIQPGQYNKSIPLVKNTTLQQSFGFYLDNPLPATAGAFQITNVKVEAIIPVSMDVVAPNFVDYTGRFLEITFVDNFGNTTNYNFAFVGGQPGAFNVPTFTPVTIAYNKQKQGWTSYYSFIPEMYGRVRDYVVSFEDGKLWVHDRNSLSKNFYGNQYTRKLTYVSNKDFPKVKDYKAIQVNGVGSNSCPEIKIAPYQGNPTGMSSALSQRFFSVKEGMQYAHFLKDKLSPGFNGNQVNALANGRNLKGQVIEVTVENNETAKSAIYSSDVLYFYSENS